MPKINRLTKDVDFEKVKKEGILIRGNFFFLSFLKNNLNFSRFGVVVSKNVSKKATERNKIKRIVREFIRQSLLSISEGYDFVIVAKRSVVGKEDKIPEELSLLLGKNIKDEKNSNISN